MADTNICDATARAEILDIKQRLTDAEEAIVGKAEATHAHSGSDYIGATEQQLAALDALAKAVEDNAGVFDAYALVNHEHEQYLTEHQSLESYATKLYVAGQIAAIPKVDLSGYALKNHEHSQYALTSAIPKLDGYATKTYVAEQIGKIDLSGVDLSEYALKDHTHDEYAPVNHSHSQYLTEHQDLSAYALKTEIPNVSGFQTEAQVKALIDDALGVIANGEY